MLNYIWLFFILTALIFGAWNGKLDQVTQAGFDSASNAVNIAIGLIGLMAFWLGIMKIAEKSDLISLISKLFKPVTARLFPDIPSDHPAIGAMVMNIAANMLGLNNAATPLGIKAMEELNELNPNKGTATNSMITFLTINTAGLQLIPITIIGVLNQFNYTNPTQIIIPTLFASITAITVGLISLRFLEKLPVFNANNTCTKDNPT